MPAWEGWRFWRTSVRTPNISKPTGAVTAKRGREELTSWSYNEYFLWYHFTFIFVRPLPHRLTPDKVGIIPCTKPHSY